MASFSPKLFWTLKNQTMDYIEFMVIGLKMNILTSAKKLMISLVSDEEQNGANFSFVASSSEELYLFPIQIHMHGKGRHHSGSTTTFEHS